VAGGILPAFFIAGQGPIGPLAENRGFTAIRAGPIAKNRYKSAHQVSQRGFPQVLPSQ
jgi:hypothetical protein